MQPRVLVVSNMYPTAANPVFGSNVRRYTDACADAGASPVVVAITDARGGARRWWKYMALAICALGRAARRDVDLVHVHYAWPTVGIGLLCARLAGVPCVVSTPGSDIAPGASSARERVLGALLRRCDRVLVMSPHQAERAVEHFGVSPAKVAVICHGADLRLFLDRSPVEARCTLGLDGRRHLVCVSRLVEGKGVDVLVRACARVPGTVLHLLGDGPLRPAIEALAASSGVEAVVHGIVDHTAVSDWLAACDGVVLPSLAEGRPTAALEALATGHRVVGFRIPALVDLVRPGLTGELADPVGSPAALADAIRLSLAQPAVDDVCVRASLPFDVRAEAQRTVRLYASLCNGNGR
jgi:glycosyltransferase involved in cell wall biosynthesis